MAEPRGMVYLVGAGPGDPSLLTRRGEALLRRADAVVYDRLVAPALLDLCRPDCAMMFVGKEGGGPSVPQDQTTRLLIDLGLAGKQVVRLKGGDPLVFGRGGEEALELRAAGVPFEIVPGVTSAIAAPAYAGIPVTHRGLASSVTIATGHEDPSKPESAINWPALATGSDTLVFLMGVEQLGAITERLLGAGRPPTEPAALVRWGTTTEQQTLRSSLGQIAVEARSRGLRPPAVLVVGKVAALAEQLAWFDSRPLHGNRILVTRAREQASVLSERLAELGATPIEFPTISIEPLRDPAPLDQALNELSGYDWVIFTSANGVSAAFTRLEAQERDARSFGTARVAAIGPATERALAEHGIRADFVPSAFTSEGIASELTEMLIKGQRLLLLRADIAPTVLVDALSAQGARVDNVIAYQTRPSSENRRAVEQRFLEKQIDVVTFTSSSTVRNLLEALDHKTELLVGAVIACIGPVTAQTARELGLRVDVVAPVHTIDGLVDALLVHQAAGSQPIEVPS
jgi:uroporphyrinogen III methyltransferase / synthase